MSCAQQRSAIVLAATLVAACTHSDSFTYSAPVVGPRSTGASVQLTFNADQDYWPSWTQDGKGILYAFVQPGPSVIHRCLGLLPASGGTRVWELCDNRAIRSDSVSSYTGYALDSTGHLLIAEAVSSRSFNFSLHPQLFLTDTATPYVRSTLLTLPVTEGDVVVSWLSDIAWTAPNSFVALGQQFGSGSHCEHCGCSPCPTDSNYYGNGVVLAGIIVNGHATVRPVAGTDGATGYALSDDRLSVVFTRLNDVRLFQVPLAGGNPITLATVVPDAGRELMGVACRHGTCLVAYTRVSFGGGFTLLEDSASTLARVSLTTGVVQDIEPFIGIVATPQVSAISGDVVVEAGPVTAGMNIAPVLGHLATYAGGNSDLYLYKTAIP